MSEKVREAAERSTGFGGPSRRMLRPALMLAAMTAVVGTASGEEKKPWVADPARGERLSAAFCTSCHLMSAEQSKPVVAGVPSFRYLRNLPSKRIAAALIKPHAPMPNMQLTRNEISDIVAYFEDQRRKEQGKPPAAKDLPKKKLTYPSAS